ncbi:MAG: hypothetical protein ACI9AR_000343 [Flavobacteriaceae bacterium]|jgi:hypothetical protein
MNITRKISYFALVIIAFAFLLPFLSHAQLNDDNNLNLVSLNIEQVGAGEFKIDGAYAGNKEGNNRISLLRSKTLALGYESVTSVNLQSNALNMYHTFSVTVRDNQLYEKYYFRMNRNDAEGGHTSALHTSATVMPFTFSAEYSSAQKKIIVQGKSFIDNAEFGIEIKQGSGSYAAAGANIVPQSNKTFAYGISDLATDKKYNIRLSYTPPSGEKIFSESVTVKVEEETVANNSEIAIIANQNGSNKIVIGGSVGTDVSGPFVLYMKKGIRSFQKHSDITLDANRNFIKEIIYLPADSKYKFKVTGNSSNGEVESNTRTQRIESGSPIGYSAERSGTSSIYIEGGINPDFVENSITIEYKKTGLFSSYSPLVSLSDLQNEFAHNVENLEQSKSYKFRIKGQIKGGDEYTTDVKEVSLDGSYSGGNINPGGNTSEGNTNSTPDENTFTLQGSNSSSSSTFALNGAVENTNFDTSKARLIYSKDSSVPWPAGSGVSYQVPINFNQSSSSQFSASMTLPPNSSQLWYAQIKHTDTDKDLSGVLAFTTTDPSGSAGNTSTGSTNSSGSTGNTNNNGGASGNNSGVSGGDSDYNPGGSGGDSDYNPDGSGGDSDYNSDSSGFNGFTNPIKIGSLQELLKKILDIVLTISIPIVAIFIIYSGFLFVTSRGDMEKLKTAKQALLYAVIGGAVVLGAWVISNAIAKTINEIKTDTQA